MTPDDLQALLDKTFPNGATAKINADLLWHVPRLMVIGVRGEQAMIQLLDVQPGAQPLNVVVELPDEDATAPLRLRTDDEVVSGGVLELTDMFPPHLKDERDQALKNSPWFKLDGED